MDSILITWIVLAILAVWSFILSILYLKNRAFAKLFFQNGSKQDAQDVFKSIEKKLLEIEKNISNLEDSSKKNLILEKSHLQKTALLRYNPFHSTGGNQSFVIALLDAKGNGFVITSLHSRENTRVYAKRVLEKQEAESTRFSREEQEAIAQAMKQ